MALTDDLWGGQLVGIYLDPVSHACDLRIRTVVDGRSTEYALACRGVTDFRLHNQIPDPWTHAEVTEVHAAADEQSGNWLVELVLWSEDAGLTVRCATIDLHEATP